MDHFDFVRREYSGPALKVVQFDRTGHFGRSNRNIPFHLTNLLFLVSLFWTLLSKTTSSFQWKVRCWIAWISHNFFWFFLYFPSTVPQKSINVRENELLRVTKGAGHLFLVSGTLFPPQAFRPEGEIPRRHSSNSRVSRGIEVRLVMSR